MNNPNLSKKIKDDYNFFVETYLSTARGQREIRKGILEMEKQVRNNVRGVRELRRKVDHMMSLKW